MQRQVGVAQDGREKIVEVVRDAAGQHAEALELLRPMHLPLERPALGDIRDHGEHAGRSSSRGA